MKRYLSVLTVLTIFFIANCSEAVITMKLGLKQVEEHQESVALRRFADIVKDRTNGEIIIDLYYAEVLGDSKKQVENTIRGLQDFYADSYSFYDPYVPEFRIIAGGIPFILGNNDDFKKLLQSDLQKELEERLLEKAGLRVLNRDKNWLRGPYRVIASKKPIKSIDDIKGLKLRLASAPLAVKSWEALGAAVAVIPYSETYLALKQGTVDAVTCPVTDALFQKFCEVAPYLTITNEYPQQIAVVMNEKRFRSLTNEQQEIIYDALNEAGDICTKLAIENGEKLVKEMKEKYGIQLIEMDLSPFKEKMLEFAKIAEREKIIPYGITERVLEITAGK